MEKQLEAVESAKDTSLDAYCEFERGVLQDNIILCDQKSGILLAFCSAVVIFCLEAFVSQGSGGHSGRASWTSYLFLAAALPSLVSCQFALTTVAPRIQRGFEDNIYWNSKAFRLPVEQYVTHLQSLDPDTERSHKLRYLHALAAICGKKFSHFRRAILFGQIGFVLLVAAEVAQAVVR